MAEPTRTFGEAFGHETSDAAESGAMIVTHAAKAVAQFVADDGRNLVGKDVALTTRVEAGANLAADVTSVVVGPEDVAAERAAVFAVKQGLEHAPQIAELPNP